MLKGDIGSFAERFRGEHGITLEFDPEAIDALRETFGITNDPLPVQYLTYLGHLFSGDLGISVSYFPEPVIAISRPQF